MKQPEKFVLYAVVDTTPGPEQNRVMAVALTRQMAKHEASVLGDLLFSSHFEHPFRVRRAKGVLFDS